MTPLVDAVVLDIGGVLFHHSFEQFEHFLRSHGASAVTDTEALKALVRWREYEIGAIGTDDFLRSVQSILPPSELSTDAIAEAWNGIFTPDAEMIELATSLNMRVPVFIISNTNELHHRYLRLQCDFDALARDIICSNHVGALKPCESIFELAEKRFNIPGSRLVFVDDNEKNVEGALSRGWHGIVHTSAKSTLTYLEKLGLGPFR